MAESKWVSATLGDISPLGDIMDEISSVMDSTNGIIDGLVQIVNGIITIVDLVSSIVSAIEDINKALIEGFLAALTAIKTALIDFLRQIFDFGLYVLPHLETFDIATAIRNILLNTGIEATSLEPSDRYIKVPDKDNPNSFHFERVRRSYRQQDFGYKQFITDILESFDDKNDLLRPQFAADKKVSGITMAVATENVKLFVVLYLLLSMLWKGKEGTTTQMGALGKVIKIALGQSETLGRTQNQDTKQELLALLEAIDETLKIREIPEDFLTIIRRFLGLTNIDIDPDATGDIGIDSVTLSGKSKTYPVFQDTTSWAITGSPISVVYPLNLSWGVQFDNTISQTLPVGNFTNSVTFKIKTTGAGGLFVIVDGTPIQVGYGQKSYDVTIPLIPIGNARQDENGNFFEGEVLNSLSINVNGTLTPYVWQNNSLNQFTTPTRAEFILCEMKEGEKYDDTLLNDARNRISFNTYLPRLNQLSSDRANLGDGYRSNTQMQLTVNESTKNKIASFMGRSKSEVDSLFPYTITRSADLTKFGPDLNTVTLKVGIKPQVQLNSSFQGYAIINGRLYTPDETKIKISSVEMTFKDVDIEDVSNITIQLISQQNITVNIAGLETEYTVYSYPEVITIKKLGGKLAAPKITSGNIVNVAENVLDISSIGGIVDGIRNSAGVDRLKSVTNQYNNVYGKPTDREGSVGSKQTEDQTQNAVYRLQGIKSEDASVYIVLKKDKETTVEWVGGEGKRFNYSLILPWNGQDTKYNIVAYQTLDSRRAFRMISEVKANGSTSQETDFIKGMGQHASEPAPINVTVTNSSSRLEATPPNWVTVSMGAFFPVVEPIDKRLTELLQIIKDSIPAGPYDGIRDWLDLVKERLDQLIKVFEFIRDVINNILGLLEIGGTGFWFLGIGSANGVEGFKQRLEGIEVPDELANAQLCTGIQLFAPDPAGSALLGLFDKLPSEGQDNVRVPEKTSLTDKLTQTALATLQTVDNKLADINSLQNRIESTSRTDVANASFRAREID